MGAPVLQQPLKKKRSIIDRLKSLSREAPSQPEPEAPPPVRYVPTHAASDFSRITVSSRAPSRQQLRFTSDESKTTALRGALSEVIVADCSEDEPGCVAAPKCHSQRLQTLAENEVVHGSWKNHSGPEATPTKETAELVVSPAKQPGPRSPGHPHSPIGESPAEGAIRMRNDAATPQTAEHRAPVVEPRAETVGKAASTSLTDYELFIAHAEADERAYRERILRNISQRSTALAGGYMVPYRDPRSEAKTPSPNRHSTANTANVSAGSTAVAGDQPDISRIDSGIASQSSRAGLRRDAEEATGMVSGSRISQSGVSQTNKARGAGAAMPVVDDRCGGHSSAAVPGPPLAAASRSNTPQQPRTLRKQTSFRQRIGEYIKPSRQRSRYDTPECATGLT